MSFAKNHPHKDWRAENTAWMEEGNWPKAFRRAALTELDVEDELG
jgi:hypothetical protein